MVLFMIMKKEFAIVLGATGNMAFALANVLIGFKKHNHVLDADIIVFEQGISEKDKNLINSILPCQFFKYKFPAQNSDFTEDCLNRFTHLSFSRYECFRLLDKYKNVLWLDIDILIQGDISGILDYTESGIALIQDGSKVKVNFTQEIPGYDLECKMRNAGVMFVNDKLENNNEIADWCYKKTIELAPYLTFADQGIINIMLQEFNLNAQKLSGYYNCHPEYKKAPDAFIIHTFCPEKFWNYYDNQEWNDNHRKWIKIGGSPYTGKRISPLSKFFKERKLPNPIRSPRNFVKHFLANK